MEAIKTYTCPPPIVPITRHDLLNPCVTPAYTMLAEFRSVYESSCVRLQSAIETIQLLQAEIDYLKQSRTLAEETKKAQSKKAGTSPLELPREVKEDTTHIKVLGEKIALLQKAYIKRIKAQEACLVDAENLRQGGKMLVFLEGKEG
ncbi:uncharacterized protein KY384_002897 [Bacidia gigantensis]|uniref:uncharacterized protein n=1 Tax=Bacidia gigantensis TaxID=2732470 RepID=UPI001D046032|nr:uncharacterized protein KY384_002897 [Bacidia gigantensis]KAG8532412.1 hypothetical protein KY384_002897 [Bacidia gigantensis]